MVPARHASCHLLGLWDVRVLSQMQSITVCVQQEYLAPLRVCNQLVCYHEQVSPCMGAPQVLLFSGQQLLCRLAPCCHTRPESHDHGSFLPGQLLVLQKCSVKRSGNTVLLPNSNNVSVIVL